MGNSSGESSRRTTVLRKQAPMRRMLIALTPCVAGAVYFFGWRSLAVVAFSCLVGFFTERFFTRNRKEPVSEAVFVTCVIFALIMPPTVPWHVVFFGTLFAVALTKELFGGFGRNIFNPAMAGRCFVYVCFPLALTAMWAPAADGPLGALDQWTTIASPDAITRATPMAVMKAEGTVPALKDMILGRMGGAMGATSALLITIGGVYVYWTKTASRTIILSTIIMYVVLNELLFRLGAPGFYTGWATVLGGGYLFGAFFIATDPVSSPKTEPARVMYGVVIATFTVIIRNYSVFNGGMMFSILLGNMLAPIMDYGVKAYQASRRAAAEGAS